MSFAFDEALFALVLLVPVVLVLRRAARLSRATAAAFGARPLSPAYFPMRLVFACAFVASLVAVAARPYVAYERSGNLLFVVDVSRRMHARYSCSEPTFLDRAKSVLRVTVDAIPEARIGLFAFDRFAFPVTQLTTDRAYIRDVIEHGLYVGLMLEATQTEIGNALDVVAAKRERLPEIYGSVSHVVLLSDGHVGGDFRRRLQSPIDKLRAADVKVSTVGIGNPGETPITVTEGGQCVSRHIEVNADKVMIPMRADILKYIATGTGGSYFSEKETARLVETLRDELEFMEPSGENTVERPRRDISGVFLAIALVSVLAYIYLPAVSRLPALREPLTE